MRVDPADSSYMPSLVVISGGPNYVSLQELSTIYIKNSDTVVTLLSDMKEVIYPILRYNMKYLFLILVTNTNKSN